MQNQKNAGLLNAEIAPENGSRGTFLFEKQLALNASSVVFANLFMMNTVAETEFIRGWRSFPPLFQRIDVFGVCAI